MTKFGDGQVFPNLTWTIDFDNVSPQENCIIIDPGDIGSNFSSKSYLVARDFAVPWPTVQFMKLNFSLKTVTYLKVGTFSQNIVL